MFPRFRWWLAGAMALLLALAPVLADARAGGGGSFGSRGSRTFMAPPTTNTAPYTASPFQRSITPPSTGYANPGFGGGYNRGFGNRSPFVSGLLGGLVGAGIGGLLFGGGLFHGISGAGGFLGLLLQLALIYFVLRWLWRRFAGGGGGGFGMMAGGGPGLFGGRGSGFAPAAPRPGMGQPYGQAYGGRGNARVAIGPADYAAFEQILKGVQAAWSAHDLRALQQLATPEMVSVFAEQMNEQASRGVRNMVGDVRLESGDLSEAWAEPGREYATVAMRFSMVDVTRDGSGRVVDGSTTERVAATEVWTFVRTPGGRWLLSGIQQTR